MKSDHTPFPDYSVPWARVVVSLVLISMLAAVLIGGLHFTQVDLEAAVLRTFERRQLAIAAAPAEEGFGDIRDDLHGLISRHTTTTWTLTGGLLALVFLTGLVAFRGARARLRLTQERKHAAEALETQQSLAISEDRYRMLFSALGEGFALYEIICDEAGKPCDYRFLEVNPAFEKLTGLAKEQIVGKTVLEVLPGTEKRWIDTYGEVALAGKSVHFENYDEALGKHLDIMAFSPRRGQFATLFVDITDRLRAQEALVHERNLLHSLMDNVPDHIYFKDTQSRFTRINKALAGAFGLDGPAEAVGKTDFDFFTDEHASEARADEKNVMAADRAMPPKEEKETWPDGRETWVSTTKVPLHDADGRIIGTFGISRDVTRRRHAADASQRHREELQLILDTVPATIWFKDTENRFLRVNKAAAESVGMSAEQIQGKSAYEMFPEEAEGYYRDDLEVMSSGKPKMGIVEQLQTARDRKIWVRTDKVPYRDPQGRIAGVIVFAVDITDRKRAEQELAHERYLLATLMNNTPDHIYFKDDQSRFMRMSKAQATRFGLDDPSGAIGRTDFDFFGLEHAEKAYADEQEVMRTGNPLVGMEERETWLDGRETWVSTTKVPLRDADGNIVGTFGISRDITDRRLAQEALRESEEKFRLAFENARDAIFWADPETTLISNCNKAAEMLLEKSRDQIIGQPQASLHPPEDAARYAEMFRRHIEGGGAVDDEAEVGTASGKRVPVHISASVTSIGGRSLIQGIFRDITRRKEVEDQLRHAQKMEAIGKLAGGVAHDFNNQLTIVKGYTELLLRQLDDEDTRAAMQEIRDAAERAARLTTQLLAFSRKQVLNPEVINLSRVLANMADPLSQMIGEDIRLSIVPDDTLGNVRADRMQVEQAVMNIMINARDAMPDGGQLTLETANVELAGALVNTRPDALPGRYVMLAITDTGSGMDAETLEHVFEPFFTTKPAGEGTGLGLAMVYGFVKQSGGTVHAYSEPGRGTTLKIYLPRVDEPAEQTAELQADSQSGPAGTETILVVEDNEAVRQLVVRVLRECGYTVLESSRGQEAMPLGRSYQNTIHLLITDVVMPGMNGPELARRLKSHREDMQVLYISGYTGDAIVDRGVVDLAARVLSKPFTPDLLARTVRDLLDEGRGSAFNPP
ncbi:MAG: PAS domain S-box protein [Phycisphaerae bacterium]|nr:PAS domain S-box protein [Phycisphaerae bacterium]